jgi:small subunit ribosomal protein S17
MSESVKSERGIRKERVGVVTSDKMDKTIVVTVERLARHKRYKKVIKISKKYYAHDENGTAKVGDEVKISETRPTSKLKRWRLVEVLKSAE